MLARMFGRFSSGSTTETLKVSLYERILSLFFFGKDFFEVNFVYPLIGNNAYRILFESLSVLVHP